MTSIMGFDQTLANCGWVTCLVEGNNLGLVGAGLIKGHWFDAGMLEPIREAVDLCNYVKALMVYHAPSLVLVEMPPIKRPGMERESSLLGCVAVAMAADDCGIQVIGVNAQKVKRQLTGFANAKKPAVREAMQKKWPQHNKTLSNEHLRDAFALVDYWWNYERT